MGEFDLVEVALLVAVEEKEAPNDMEAVGSGVRLWDAMLEGVREMLAVGESVCVAVPVIEGRSTEIASRRSSTALPVERV